jgi:hypothetical protein
MNGLRQVLWESVRPVQRKSVTQAFPDVAVGAEFGLAQFGQRLAMYWATEREPEWIAAFVCSLVFSVFWM